MRLASLVCLCAGACSAYQVMMGGSALKNGVSFRYETRVEPRIEGQKVLGFGAGGIHVGERFHRYLVDADSRRFLGYDLDLQKGPAGNLSLTLGPLTLTAEKLGLKGDWTRLPLRVSAEPQVVSIGDEIAVEMFSNPATGQKIVDHVFFEKPGSEIRLPAGVAKDFTIDDVPLTFTDMKLLLNGRQMHQMHGSISGEATFFYLPGHGRVAMSLAPNRDLGFRKLGEVRGSQATVRNGNDTWTMECSRPIAPGGGVFNLYVYPDSAWRPKQGADAFLMGASSARSMLRSK